MHVQLWILLLSDKQHCYIALSQYISIVIKQFQVEDCHSPVHRWAVKSVLNCVLSGIKKVSKSRVCV